MRKYYTITILFLLQMVASFEMSGLLAIGAYAIESFGAEGSMVMYLSIGAYAVGFFSPFCGNFADKYGRKKYLLISLVLFAVGSICIILSSSLVQFIISRALTGFFVYTVNAIILSYLGDIVPYENRGKVFGIIRVAFALGIVLSPIYTTQITLNYGIEMLYKLYLIYSIILFFALLFIPEVKAEDNNGKINISDIKEIVHDKVARNFIILQCLLTFAGTCVFGYLSVHILNALNKTITQSGYAYTAGGLGTITAALVSVVLLDKVDRFKYAKIMFGAVVIVILPLSFVKTPLLYICMYLFSFSLDSAWPVFQLLASEVVPDRKSTFMSILAGLISVTNILVVFIGQILYNIGGFRITNILGSILMMISTCIIIVTIKKYRNRLSR